MMTVIFGIRQISVTERDKDPYSYSNLAGEQLSRRYYTRQNQKSWITLLDCTESTWNRDLRETWRVYFQTH